MHACYGGPGLDEMRTVNGKTCSTIQIDDVQQYVAVDGPVLHAPRRYFAIDGRAIRVRMLDTRYEGREFSGHESTFSQHKNHTREVDKVKSLRTSWNKAGVPAVHHSGPINIERRLRATYLDHARDVEHEDLLFVLREHASPGVVVVLGLQRVVVGMSFLPRSARRASTWSNDERLLLLLPLNKVHISQPLSIRGNEYESAGGSVTAAVAAKARVVWEVTAEASMVAPAAAADAGSSETYIGR